MGDADARRLDEGGLTERTTFRARFGLGVEHQRLSAFFLPQAAGTYGLTGGGNRPLTDPNLGLHQAWMRYHGETLWFQAGRFELTYGEERVLARANWNQIGRAWDALRLG